MSLAFNVAEAPNGRPWVFLGTRPPVNWGFLLDTDGQWWINGAFGLIRTGPPGSGSGLDDVLSKVTETVVPLAFEMVKYFPVGGTIAHAAYKAARAMSGGETLTSAILSTAREQVVGGSMYNARAFDEAYAAATAKASSAALEALREKVLDNDAVRTAFDLGTSFGLGKAVQEDTIAYAKDQLVPPEKGEVFDQALAHGGDILHAIGVLGGDDAAASAADFINQRSAEITGGEDGGSDGPSVMGLLALGIVGYGAYRLLGKRR